MHLYLPIAELSVNVLILIGMGGAVGFLAGMFGVGGGFLITPLLIFYNIPPAIAVATGANQVIASSVSGALAHFRRGTIDLKLGGVLLAGGAAGSVFGVWVFTVLRQRGQLDFFVSVLYVFMLGIVGSLMLIESVVTMRRNGARGSPQGHPSYHHSWIHRLPLQMRFRRSHLCISVIPILVSGTLIGMLGAVMGVGGGFIMVPLMIYLLRVPTIVAVGTSLFQIIFTSAVTTVLQAATNGTIDIGLAFFLMIGGVAGAQFGAQAGRRIRSDQLRALLAVLVLAVCLGLGAELVMPPANPFSITLDSGQAS